MFFPLLFVVNSVVLCASLYLSVLQIHGAAALPAEGGRSVLPLHGLGSSICRPGAGHAAQRRSGQRKVRTIVNRPISYVSWTRVLLLYFYHTSFIVSIGSCCSLPRILPRSRGSAMCKRIRRVVYNPGYDGFGIGRQGRCRRLNCAEQGNFYCSLALTCGKPYQ